MLELGKEKTGIMKEKEGTGIHKKRRLKADSESGRSMVETLGVLAIIGLLAIGGIAGYRYAMDKYNANEILNEVRKRAVTTAGSYNGNMSFFSLTVLGIEKGVCDKVIAEKIPFVVEEKIGDVVVEEETACAEGENNDVTFVFKNTLEEDVDLKCEGITCPEGTSCSAGRCLCPNGWEKCGDICCAEGEICSAAGQYGYCVRLENGCTRNEDCKNEEGYINTNQFCNIQANTCELGEAVGICEDKQALPTPIFVPHVGNTYFSPMVLKWWGAKNYCLSHGKRLISVRGNALQCFNPEIGETEVGFCNKNQNGINWVGRDAEKSESMKPIFENYTHNTNNIWTDSDYSSCYSFLITRDGGIEKYYRNTSGAIYHALCID